MKRINKIIGIVFLTVALFVASCSNILDEQPRTFYEPGFFKTEKGVENGLTSLYARLRYIYGNMYYNGIMTTGTDEATYGGGSGGRDGNFVNADMKAGDSDLNPTSSRSDVLWNNMFPNINTANGIIENGEAAGMNPALIAEAYFFRAFAYFNLVQTFGGVPLDLGSGELKFNSAPSTVSVRNTVPEVYSKCIFPDLEKAVADLPVNPRVTGGVTKTLARLYLAKAYLTYGWWLQNPNSIPTYPEATRTDPNGKTAAQYFQSAYDVALGAINEPGPFGLQPTFRDVNVATNDRNNEILLYVDHTQADEFYNGASLTYSNGDQTDNATVWSMTWFYEQIRSANTSGGGGSISSVQREVAQWGGRPWIRAAFPVGVFTNTFADKVNDSRFDGTFSTVLRGNWNKNSTTAVYPELYNANNMPVKVGEPVISFELDPALAGTITYPAVGDKGVSNVGAGWLPGRADWVVGTDRISRILYPSLWKLGVYRTDNGSGYGQVNSASTRPFSIAKFSELYLVAAEAAVQGATGTMSAVQLVNKVRERAGKWNFNNAQNTVVSIDNSAAMIAATPDPMTLNFILAERSREFFGEGYRWLDLVRTQKWNELAGTYQIRDGSATGFGDNPTVQTFQRDIKPTHYLRPIPQGQIDALDMTVDEKKAYQNPGY